MKRLTKLMILGIILGTLTNNALYSQVSIEDCQELARKNYPMVKQFGLIEQSREYTLSNAGRGYLPQISISARSTYQSEVTKLPQSLLNMFSQLPEQAATQNQETFSLEMPGRGQYQIVAEVNQVIWDGGVISSQKEITNGNSKIEKQQLEVELYSLKERIAQLFFGILIMEKQQEQTTALIDELHINHSKIEAMVKNGIARPSSLEEIQAEELMALQRLSAVKSTINAYREMLSAMAGDPSIIKQKLQKPGHLLDQLSTYNHSYQPSSPHINRPELSLFHAQSQIQESQEKLVKTAAHPKLSLFFHGGYGDPGLNMFNPGLTGFYILGAKLVWNLGSLYTQSNTLRNLEVNKSRIQLQKNKFLYNTGLSISRSNNEIEQLKEQLTHDNRIIELRTNILESAESSLANGTITVSDLLREINALNTAKTEQQIRELQLLMAIYKLNYITNN
ncbi:MAG: TolC family protein [Bacteroidales bacterium]|nr:TolC family protein [Bacteroidales bacterium]